MLDKLEQKEIWVTQQEYIEWGIQESVNWEIVEKDYQKARVKIRRIDNVRNGTSKEV